MFPRLAGSLLLIVLLIGCGGVREETIQIKKADPLDGARAVLQRYADGQPVLSEVSSFPALVDQVRKADPAKADMLDKGLKEIEKNPGSRVAIAKDLLKKLGPAAK